MIEQNYQKKEPQIEKRIQEIEKIQNKNKIKSEIYSSYTSFYKARDGTLIEMTYNSVEETTGLAIYKDGEAKYQQSVLVDNKRLFPYSANNNLVKHKVVLFPSEAKEYNSEAELLKEISDFIYQYVDLSPFFQKLTPYYVLFSWVYDCFNELPYLRFIGDTGSGKTRAVETIGSICYKPIFATGGASVSPIFRILDLFRGTLLIDEADYRFSDEKAEIMKILNCGNTPTFPVLRSESKKQKEFNPIAFQVFGPKIFDTRRYFQDPALENRCITEEMGEQKLRDDIPINLPDEFWQEALEIRNKLLMFRFRNYGQKKINPELNDKSIEPRLNQIIVPLASIISDQEIVEQLKFFIKEYNEQLISDRGMEEAGQVLEIIKKIISPAIKPDGWAVSIKEITSRYMEEYGDKTDSGKPVNTKWIGWILRKNLKLKTKREERGYIIPKPEIQKLENLFRKYGIKNEHNEYNEHK
jgi:predicted house-cleaning noncanonical NTP pyrophosphatase (MazG superfamily)